MVEVTILDRDKTFIYRSPVAPVDLSTCFVEILKIGSGDGTITLDEYICEVGCPTMFVLYADFQSLPVQADPAGGSKFLGWLDESGNPLTDFHNVIPGSVVMAIFELE